MKITVPMLVGATFLALSPPGHAAPDFCTTAPIVVGSGGSIPAATLLTPGVCAAAGDKVFGAFAANAGITGNGSGSFTFLSTPGNVTLGFSGVVTPSTTGTIDYTVAVDPALSAGFLINDLEKDFTLNASLTGLPASATLTGSTTADPAFVFDCTRAVNPSSSTCPQTDVFGTTAQMSVVETITTGPNAIVTAITDTISQIPAIPEPSSLALLGGSLIMLGFAARRHRQH
jgi:hypothetical protein